MTLRHIVADTRLSLRMLARQPWSTLTIAGTLALGIGATTAIYALFNFVLFRPVPGVSSEERLFTAQFKSRDQKATAYGAVAALPAMRAAVAAIGVDRLAAGDGDTAAIAAPAEPPTFEEGEYVTAQYFSALGLRPRLGQLFTDAQIDGGADNIVVISERLWRLKFAGAADAIGKTLVMNGHTLIVTGVVERFRGWAATRIGTKDWWVPMGAMRTLTGSPPSSVTSFIGRVRADVSLTLVEQQLQKSYTDFSVTLDARSAAFVPFVAEGLQGFGATLVRTNGMRMYWLLLGAAGVLLLLACVNAATMLLARAHIRERETAIRLAIGADRIMVLRQFLIESLGLAGIAGALGLLVAFVMSQAFRGMRVLAYFPAVDAIDLDVRVLAFCMAVALTTVIGFGVIPAVLASRADVRHVLGRAGRTIAGSNRLRHALVISQIALSLVLVAGAAVLNRSLQNLLTTDLGMDIRGVYKLSLKPDSIGYNSARSRQTVLNTIDALRNAGFRAVASSSPEPLSGNTDAVAITLGNGEPLKRSVFASSVSANYFELFGMHFVRGRSFTDADAQDANSPAPMPVILSASMAADLFGTDAAIGRTFGLTRAVGMATMPATAIVVGVVADTRSSAVRNDPREAIYHTRPSGWRYTQILVRPDGPVGPALDRIRAVVRDVDPNLPITTLRPLAADVEEDLSQDRVLALSSGLVAVLAGLLGAAGVFSVVSQLVAERTRDFGIRAALGASRRDIMRHVLAGVGTRAIAGIVVGLGLYGWLSRYLGGRLYGIDRVDPITMTVVAGLLLALTLLAAAWPARRAAHADPAVTLRAD